MIIYWNQSHYCRIVEKYSSIRSSLLFPYDMWILHIVLDYIRECNLIYVSTIKLYNPILLVFNMKFIWYSKKILTRSFWILDTSLSCPGNLKVRTFEQDTFPL